MTLSPLTLLLPALFLLAPAAGAQEGTGAGASNGALVITRGADGQPITTWVREGPDGLEEVASRPGAFIAAGGTLWSWEPVTVGLDLCVCEFEGTECAGQRHVETDAAKLSSVAGTVLLDPAALIHQVSPDRSDFGYGAVLEAVVGRYALVHTSFDVYGCRASYAYTADAFTVYDLDAGAVVAVPSPEVAAAVAASEGPAALSQLRDQGSDVFGETVELTRVLPEYDVLGALNVQYQLTADSSYAGGDGEWSSYTVSTLRPAPALPEAFRPYTQLPEAVRAFRVLHPETQMVGWSPFAADPTTAAGQAEAFRPAP